MGKYHDAYQKRRWKGPAWGVFFILVLLLAVGFAIKGCRGGQPAEEAEETPAAPAVTGDVRQTPEPHDYSILVKKGEFTLFLLDHGEPVAQWPVALGKNPGQKQMSGDMKTPEGTFPVDEIIDASSWSHDFHDGKGVIQHAYGPWFISLDTRILSQGKWDGIGIHGTHDPASIGTRASEGCIRMNNEDLEKLKACVKVGTKVTVEE